MNHKLTLNSFDAPAPEPLRIRVTRYIGLASSPETSPRTARCSGEAPSDSGVRQLILRRTFARSVTLVGTLTTIGLLMLVFGWVELAEAAPVRRSLWAEGVIVSADVAHKSFVLAPRGRNSPLLFSWDGHTHEWDRTIRAKAGKTLEPAAVTNGRLARVFFQKQGTNLVAKRVIFLSANLAPRPPALPPAKADS